MDFFQPGEMQPERDHNVQGEKSVTGEFSGRKWRHATDGGWFSWEMKTSPDQPQRLALTYWGGDAGNRVFDVFVGGTKIATQMLDHNRPGKFYDMTHELPFELTRGKTNLTIKLQAWPGKWAGGLYGARLLLKDRPTTNHSPATPEKPPAIPAKSSIR